MKQADRCAGSMITSTNTPRSPRAARVAAVLVLAVSASIALSACSGAGSPSAADTQSTSGIGARWGACMRDAGFDVEDPADDMVASGTVTIPQGVDQGRYEEEAASCSDRVGVQRADTSEEQKWARQYSQVADCIREHGYDDFPEQTDGGITTQGYPRASEPEFEETFQQCLHEYSPDTKTQAR